MTRGKFVIITDKGTFSSLEFNGDMYFKEGHGPEVVERLARVSNVKDLIKEVDAFNTKNFHYEVSRLDLTYKASRKNFINFFRTNYYDIWFSDYLYIKNTMDSDTRITLNDGTNYILPPQKICVIYFGKSIRTEYKDNGLIKE